MDRISSTSLDQAQTERTGTRLIARPRRPATATFEHATVRHGAAEHERLDAGTTNGSDFAHGQARMLVLPDRCMVSTDDSPVEVELVICRGEAEAAADLLYRLSPGSWLSVDDAWDWPLFDALPEDREARTRIELPDGRVRITSRLARGARLCVRLSNATA